MFQDEQQAVLDDGFNKTVAAAAAITSAFGAKDNGYEDNLVGYMPFNPKEENATWGQPYLLKKNENFVTHSGVKTYINWFDGWSVDQYTTDLDMLTYY